MSEPFAKPRTLLLLTNQELWPGIICTRHFRPEKIILLHGNTPAASKEPAVRLQKFLLKSGLVDKCELLELPDDDFVGIQQRLDTASIPEPLAVGFNGATKLMAVACFDWARQRSKQACYLETDGQLRRFDFSGGKLEATFDTTDSSSCDALKPVEVIKSHVHRSALLTAGHTLTLRPEAKTLEERSFFDSIISKRKAGPYPLLLRDGNPVYKKHSQEGEHLELCTAACLLRLGVKSVQRGIELRPRNSINSGEAHTEIDLAFLWGNRMWVVECKDRESIHRKFQVSEQEIHQIAGPRGFEVIGLVAKAISPSAKQVIRSRVVAARECGGALAQVIYVTKSEPDPNLAEFAASWGVHLVLKARLFDGLASALHSIPLPSEKA